MFTTQTFRLRIFFPAKVSPWKTGMFHIIGYFAAAGSAAAAVAGTFSSFSSHLSNALLYPSCCCCRFTSEGFVLLQQIIFVYIFGSFRPISSTHLCN